MSVSNEAWSVILCHQRVVDLHNTHMYSSLCVLSHELGAPVLCLPLNEQNAVKVVSLNNAPFVCLFVCFCSAPGEWSSSGCTMVSTNQTHTVCSCTHLTNFAILMNTKGVYVSQLYNFFFFFYKLQKFLKIKHETFSSSSFVLKIDREVSWEYEFLALRRNFYFLKPNTGLK